MTASLGRSSRWQRPTTASRRAAPGPAPPRPAAGQPPRAARAAAKPREAPAAAKPPEAAKPAAAAGTPKKGGVLIIGATDEAADLDPHFQNALARQQRTQNI